jgi:hypothetical protein
LVSTMSGPELLGTFRASNYLGLRPSVPLYNHSSTHTVFSLLSSTISHRPEQAFNLTRRRSEYDVAPETRNPFDSTDSHMVSLSHSEIVLVRYTWAKQKLSFHGTWCPNFVCSIGWCSDRFRRYDGTSILLMECRYICEAHTRGATADLLDSLAR